MQCVPRLAAAISEQSCFSVELVRGYGLQSFRDGVEELMIKTGVKGERVAFLFTDTQVVPDDFLEDVNNGEAVNADRDRMGIGVQTVWCAREQTAGKLSFRACEKICISCLPCLQWASICASGAVDFLRS